jgi:hypothetical protein
MSFISLESTGIHSPSDIMADSVGTRQMLLTLNSKLDHIINLLTGDGHKPVSELVNTKAVVKDACPENE